MPEVKQGDPVNFLPSARTKREKFLLAREDKHSFAAIVNDVNDDSVDLTVFSGHGTVEVKNVKHASEAAEGRSSWTN